MGFHDVVPCCPIGESLSAVIMSAGAAQELTAQIESAVKLQYRAVDGNRGGLIFEINVHG